MLGFDNLAGRPDVDYLGAALLQMLPTELGRTGRLRLVPAENVARARTDLSLTRSAALGPATLSRVRSYLGADLAIGGSYLVTGPEGRTRFDVQMQDTRTGETLATLSESKALSDYTLQRKAALAVVRKGRALDARVLIAEGRFQEGYAALNQGEPAAAKAALDDAAELFEGAGDRESSPAPGRSAASTSRSRETWLRRGRPISARERSIARSATSTAPQGR